MNETHDEQLRALLRRTLPPMSRQVCPPDLWPRMRRRLIDRPSRWAGLDYALAGVVVLAFVCYPELIPWVLFHC